MMPDLKYYDDKFPYSHDMVLHINGVDNSIGKHSYGIELINRFHYDPMASFHIGRFCAIAHTTFYLGGSKPYDAITTAFFMPKFFSKSDFFHAENTKKVDSSKNKIVLGHDVWVGNNSTIMHGVSIGNGAIIAANSHVVKSVPSYAIVGGNPAKVIALRFSREVIVLLNELAWWELDDDIINQVIPILKSKPTVAMINGLIADMQGLNRTNNLHDYS